MDTSVARSRLACFETAAHTMGMLDFMNTSLDRLGGEGANDAPPGFWRSLLRFVVWWSTLLAVVLSLGLMTPGAS